MRDEPCRRRMHQAGSNCFTPPEWHVADEYVKVWMTSIEGRARGSLNYHQGDRCAVRRCTIDRFAWSVFWLSWVVMYRNACVTHCLAIVDAVKPSTSSMTKK